MKKLSVLLAVFLVSASLQLVVAQSAEQKAAIDIIKAYKNKDAALLKNYVTGFIAMAITDDFFDSDDGKPAVEMATKWDGKIREIRYETGDLMGKPVILASVYFGDSDTEGVINVVTLSSMDKSTWKAFALGISTISKAEFEKMPTSLETSNAEAKTNPADYSIEMANGDTYNNVSAEKIKELLGTLDDDNFFIILNSKNGFLQASTSEQGFIVQYSEDKDEILYEAEDYFTMDKAIDIFVTYFEGGDWKSQAKWVVI